ncbi:MAG: hypothetical protein WC697_03420 [Patescibacteria group bacterium]|jgi:hypothetical protein
MFSRIKIKNYIKKKFSTDILKDQWEKLSDKGKDDMIEYATNIFEKETEKFQNTLFEADDKADDLIFYFFGILVGIMGNLVANIIQSFLGKFGVLYYVFSFIIFSLILVSLFYMARDRISKIYRRNKTVKEFFEYCKNKKINHN